VSDAPGHRIEPFDAQDEVSADDVVAIWRRETGMPEDVARERVGQLLVVAIGDEGDVAGVSTAYLRRNEQLRMEMWHVRVFVARAHRGGKLAIALAQRGRELLRDRHADADGDTRAGGVLFEVQHEGLKTIDRAHWRRTGFTFIGENEHGDHVRVAFFDGVLAPEPAA
jgi:hypothetical protein